MGGSEAKPWQVLLALASLEFGFGNDATLALYRAHLRRHRRERITALAVIVRMTRVSEADAAYALQLKNPESTIRAYHENPPPADEVAEFARLVNAIFRKARAVHLRARYRAGAK